MQYYESILILPDIHADKRSLEAVLEDADRKYGFSVSPEVRKEKNQKIVVLGDYTGKGPNPCEVIQMLMHIKPIVLQGNWENNLFSKKNNLFSEIEQEETLKRLSPEEIAYIKEHNQIEYRVKAYRGRDIILTHSHTLAKNRELAPHNFSGIAQFLSGNFNGLDTKGIYLIAHYHEGSSSHAYSVFGSYVGSLTAPVVPGFSSIIHLGNRNELHHLPAVSSMLDGCKYSGYAVLMPEKMELHIQYCNR